MKRKAHFLRYFADRVYPRLDVRQIETANMADSEAVHIGEFAWINDEPLGTRGLVESIEIDIRVVGAGEGGAEFARRCRSFRLGT